MDNTQHLKLRCFIHGKKSQEEDVEYVNLPALSGDLGVMINHDKRLAVLKKGKMYYKKPGSSEKIYIDIPAESLAKITGLEVIVFINA